MNIEQARFNMIEQQIRPWDVLDPQVLDLLFVVKREDFVPDAYRNLAFADMEIPLGQGQAMLAPKIEAKLLQELGVKKTDKILEIGTGSGYMAALLAKRADHVVSLEIRPEIAAVAKAKQPPTHEEAVLVMMDATSRKLIVPGAGYNFGLVGLEAPLTVKAGATVTLPLLLIAVDRPSAGPDISLATVLESITADLARQP